MTFSIALLLLSFLSFLSSFVSSSFLLLFFLFFFSFLSFLQFLVALKLCLQYNWKIEPLLEAYFAGGGEDGGSQPKLSSKFLLFSCGQLVEVLQHQPRLLFLTGESSQQQNDGCGVCGETDCDRGFWKHGSCSQAHRFCVDCWRFTRFCSCCFVFFYHGVDMIPLFV